MSQIGSSSVYYDLSLLTQSRSHGPPDVLGDLQDVGGGRHAVVAGLLGALGVDGGGDGRKKILNLGELFRKIIKFLSGNIVYL